jgi:hypothetical protein
MELKYWMLLDSSQILLGRINCRIVRPTFHLLIRVALPSQTLPTMQRLYAKCNAFPLYPYYNAFPISCVPVLLCVRLCQRKRVCVFLQVWCHKCNRLWQNTLNVFKKNHTCHDFHTDVDCFVMIVVRTDYISRTFSHITSRTVAARVANCERSSLSFWGLHCPFLKQGLRLE